MSPTWIETHQYVFDPSEAVSGNKVRILCDGPQIFEAIFDAIESARYRIALEIYEFAPDETGRKVRDALVSAARKGIQIKLIYDSIGSLFTDREFFSPLKTLGGEVMEYHPLKPWQPHWRWIKRNHRKMLIIDAERAIIGGFNISDPYRYAPDHMGYHDLAVEVKGPACGQAWALFHETWRKGEKPKPFSGTDQRTRRRELLQGDQTVHIVGNDHFTDRWRIRRLILYAISQAKHSINITNPYFLPDPAMINSLVDAVRRGVHVRVLVPSKTDVGILDTASTLVQHRLVRKGVEVHRWPGFAHGKAIEIDRLWISVGSFNFDYRSVFHNLEIVVHATDEACGSRLRDILDADIRTSRQVHEQDWKQMPLVSRLLARLLYRLRALL